ncbi:conserved hypothetical protein [Trichinella spiralis]|uniref:hypothetical protein n=1 Tax=Trichinella spiralis TaxID=6334 RepID=UPI0001EFE324|nr:conserved hypothetical protein [Trichinella spiralis]
MVFKMGFKIGDVFEIHDLDQPRCHGSDQAKAVHAFDCPVDPHLACKMEREGQFQEKEQKVQLQLYTIKKRLTLLWIYKSLATRKNSIQQQCKTVPQAARASSIFLIILKEQSLVNVILFYHSFGSCKLAFATSNNLIHFAIIQPYVNDTFKFIPHWFHKQLCLPFMHLCQINWCQQFIAHIL